jgi:Uma2 family endonuclease
MPAVIIEGDVFIPEWVKSLASFRRWCDSEEFPEEGRIDYLQGEVWVDMSWEQVFSHNQVKQEYNLVVGGLAKLEKRGRYFPDGARWSNVDVDISIIPDGLFISTESMRDANIKFIEGAREGYVEIEGFPDMALEIMSDSSVKKDSKRLPKLYWEAGVKEYWLVDVRGDRLEFTIYRHAKKGYVASRKLDGWMKSPVFGKSFRLTRGEDEFGQPEFTLEAR